MSLKFRRKEAQELVMVIHAVSLQLTLMPSATVRK
jgi:hypothetical protein